MKPRRKKERGVRRAQTNWNTQAYHHAQQLQASLQRRLNRTASIAEIIPGVLAQLTCTNPTRRRL
jgi:hypothetical protein